jgi:hypothetical protein
VGDNELTWEQSDGDGIGDLGEIRDFLHYRVRIAIPTKLPEDEGYWPGNPEIETEFSEIRQLEQDRDAELGNREFGLERHSVTRAVSFQSAPLGSIQSDLNYVFDSGFSLGSVDLIALSRLPNGNHEYGSSIDLLTFRPLPNE